MLRITTYINKVPIWVAVFLLFCIYFLGRYLNSNEEMYLLLAKQFCQPDFIPNSFNLTQPPGNRLLYQYIAGYMLQYLPFQDVTLIGRAVLCLLVSFPIARIAKLFELSLIETLFIIPVFFLAQQAFFAYPWMFISFEAKGISYVFILWGVYFLLKNQLNISILSLAIATWFHVLVGGWTFVIVFIYMLLQKSTLKQLFIRALIYTVLVSPLIWYLLQEILLNNPTVINEVSVDWIYTQFRNPHHTSPFTHLSSFAPGILTMIAWGIACFFFFNKLEHPVLKRVNLLNLIIIGLMLLFLGIAWFDENGAFTKFYPFRPNTLLKFLLIFEAAMVVKLWLIKPNFLPYINTLLLVFTLSYLSTPTYHLIKSHQPDSPKEILWNEFTTYIQQNTPKDAVFINFNSQINSGADAPVSFSRKTRRESFVIFKFVPLNSEQTYEWYQRVLERNKLVGNLDYLFKLNKEYRIDYLITSWRIDREGLQLKYNNGSHFLYKIKE